VEGSGGTVFLTSYHGSSLEVGILREITKSSVVIVSRPRVS
jgi:hypothetical protein